MGYVGQEPILFNATIRENMQFSKRGATDAEIEQALRDANAWSFIKNKMKKGLDTYVGGAGVTKQMKAYAQSAGYADQALYAIRVVQSYGQESLENENYTAFLHRASTAQKEAAVGQAVGLSVVYLIIFGFYGYAFYFGGMFRTSNDPWFINDMTEKRYTGGEVLGILFMILQAMFPITALGPNVKAFTEAKIGGKLAFDVIDTTPDVRYGEGAPIRTPVRG